jgi:ribosome-binding protein aMBF1 (putative translation factor)
MSKPFKTLRKKMSLPARKAAAAKTKEMLKEMPLRELRQAHQMSQERLAELLLTKQANVSRIERRTDMYISTLRSYIEAMGGKLDIIAKFPDGEVYINQFEDIHRDLPGVLGVSEQKTPLRKRA